MQKWQYSLVQYLIEKVLMFWQKTMMKELLFILHVKVTIYLSVVQYLIEKGADIETKDIDQTG